MTDIDLFLSISNGDGYGSGNGNVTSYYNGFGFGDGDGVGYSDGTGTGSGYCNGYCNGDGYGYYNGYGAGSGYGISSIEGSKVYYIDDIPTIIKHLRNNIAKGFILNDDLSLSPCFVVKEGNEFAHGKTLHEAFEALQEKKYDDSSEEERITKFKSHFKDFSIKYKAKELFVWHHILTGSCKLGRENFCKNHGIDIDNDEFTIYQFIELTKGSYNGEIIRKLKD